MSRKSATDKKRIFIVDDHPMMRQGLAQLIGAEKEMMVCGESENAERAVGAVKDLKPDLVLADISLPGRNGLELIKDFQAIQPGLPVLVISMHDESLYAERVLRAGGRGYIMKQEGGKKLMQAIRQVLEGKIYVSEKMSADILEIFSGRRAGSESSPVEKLTDREFEVFQLISHARHRREIAFERQDSRSPPREHQDEVENQIGVGVGSLCDPLGGVANRRRVGFIRPQQSGLRTGNLDFRPAPSSPALRVCAQGSPPACRLRRWKPVIFCGHKIFSTARRFLHKPPAARGWILAGHRHADTESLRNDRIRLGFLAEAFQGGTQPCNWDTCAGRSAAR
jgi:DNA-binding NarL/FixJ family response regulator